MVKRYTYRYADDGDLYRHEEPDGKYVLYSDYAALEARLAEVEREWDEAIENGMAVSASCCPWVNKGGLYAGPDGYPGCGVKDRLAEVEAQRAELKAALTTANAKLADIKDALYGRGLEVLGWHLNGDTEPLDNWFGENDWEPMASEAFAKMEEK